MKPLAFLACLVLSWTVNAADMEGLGRPAGATEPTNGLVAVLLSPAELGPVLTRQIRVLLDPPSIYYAEPDFQEPPHLAPGSEHNPELPFLREQGRLGAEALVYLAYGSNRTWYYMQVLRFGSAKDAEAHWQKRLKEGKSGMVGSPAGNLIWTRTGQPLSPGVNARTDTVECIKGNYLVSLAPCRPNPHDEALKLLAKQMEKISKFCEPAAGGNAE